MHIHVTCKSQKAFNEVREFFQNPNSPQNVLIPPYGADSSQVVNHCSTVWWDENQSYAQYNLKNWIDFMYYVIYL